jgi:hypothetical protein
MCFTILNHSSNLWLKRKMWALTWEESPIVVKLRLPFGSQSNIHCLESGTKLLLGIFSVLSVWKTYCSCMDCCHASCRTVEDFIKWEKHKSKYLTKVFIHLYFLCTWIQKRIKAYQSRLPKECQKLYLVLRWRQRKVKT